MARIRSIKPEFWKSETIADLSMQTRLTFIALWSYVDDNGVGRDIDKLIAAELYPLEDDPRETLAHVQRSLAELSEAGRIVRYTVAGKPYLSVVNWSEHQKIDKPNKPRYPGPEEADEPLTCGYREPRDTLAEPSRHSRESPSPGAVELGTEEQRNRGELLAPAKPTRERDEIWDALLDSCNIDPPNIPAAARGAYNSATKQLRDIGATPSEIRRRAAIYRGQWPGVSLTPTALARRWAECERSHVTTSRPDATTSALHNARTRALEATQAERKALP